MDMNTFDKQAAFASILYFNFSEEDLRENLEGIAQQLIYEFSEGNVNIIPV